MGDVLVISFAFCLEELEEGLLMEHGELVEIDDFMGDDLIMRVYGGVDGYLGLDVVGLGEEVAEVLVRYLEEECDGVKEVYLYGLDGLGDLGSWVMCRLVQERLRRWCDGVGVKYGEGYGMYSDGDIVAIEFYRFEDGYYVQYLSDRVKN